MPSGGARPGAGRPRGAVNGPAKRRRERALVNGELLPLDYCLRVMRDDKAAASRRDEMAKAALPFLHPRLSPSKPEANPGELPPIDPENMSEAQLEALLTRIHASISRRGGVGSGRARN